MVFFISIEGFNNFVLNVFVDNIKTIDMKKKWGH